MTNSFRDIKNTAKEYLGLKTDALKLRLIENLSAVFNKVLLLFVLSALVLIALVFCASGVNHWLSTIVSPGLSAFIIAAFFFLCALVIFFFRKNLFTNSFVALFANIFFEEKPDDKKEEDQL